jgi:hypothetical protein
MGERDVINNRAHCFDSIFQTRIYMYDSAPHMRPVPGRVLHANQPYLSFLKNAIKHFVGFGFPYI